jgi:hypothetical protein
LRLGIYGQVAAGGDVGGFFAPPPADRSRARDKKRSERLGHAGRRDVALSERLAAMVDSSGRLSAVADDPAVAAALRDRLAARLKDVLAQWRATAPGEQLVLV